MKISKHQGVKQENGVRKINTDNPKLGIRSPVKLFMDRKS